MLTGAVEMVTVVDCLSHGAMDHLAKPLLGDEVRVRVENALEKRRCMPPSAS
jgi:DNA-binding response OmpR family regulator